MTAPIDDDAPVAVGIGPRKLDVLLVEARSLDLQAACIGAAAA
jgi:hypothetical protein